MKTIKEKAEEYSLKENSENTELSTVKYEAYLEGAHETLQTVLDRVKDRKKFEMIRMDVFAILVQDMLYGSNK